MQVGPYELLEELGRGGFGAVHRARHVGSGDEVALKLLPPASSLDPEEVLRFQREVEALTRPRRRAGLVRGVRRARQRPPDAGRPRGGPGGPGGGAAARSREAQARVGLGMLRHDAGDLDGALAQFDAAIELEPEHAAAWLLRGRVHTARGDPAAAEADFTRSLELDPRGWEAWTGRAGARYRLGRLDEALADLDRSVGMRPVQPEPYEGRADLRLLRGDSAGALEDLRAALERTPAASSRARQLAELIARFEAPAPPRRSAGLLARGDLLLHARPPPLPPL